MAEPEEKIENTENEETGIPDSFPKSPNSIEEEGNEGDIEKAIEETETVATEAVGEDDIGIVGAQLGEDVVIEEQRETDYGEGISTQFGTSIIEAGTDDTHFDEKYGEEGEVGAEEFEDEDYPATATSVVIEIPDLYQDASDESLPDLQDVPVGKVEKEQPPPDVLDLTTAKPLEELEATDVAAENEVEYEELSMVEEYTYDEMEGEISEKDVIKEKPQKKVEIEEAPLVTSDSDLLFNLFMKEEFEEDVKAKMKEEEQENLADLTGVRDLLEDIIEESIHKSEQIDPDAILQARLDRDKLMTAFKTLVSDIKDEHRKRFLLNKKVVEYFRRKKYKRALVEDNPETIVDAMKRYRECLLRLDRVKAHDVVLRSQLETKLNNLRNTEQMLRSDSEAKTELLNKRLKEVGLSTTSSKTGQPMSEKVVNALIRQMNNVRNQISELRLIFIKAQHKMATLMHQTRKLEDIGDGLKMIDFEQLRAEAQGLGDKVEERNNELSKLRDRHNADTHFLAHIREKQFIVNQTITLQEDILKQLKDELNFRRNYVNRLKLERDSIRKNFNEMSYECGLLDKPYLLHDYDTTVEQIIEAQRRVDDLKDTRESILKELKNTLQKLEQFS